MNYYAANGTQLAQRYEKAEVSDLHTALLNAFPPKSRLLELGCGSGRDMAFMARNNFQVTAIDASPSMIRAAQELHHELKDAIHLGTLPDGFPDHLGTFDGIFSIAVLMHLSRPEIEVALKNIKAHLIPRGLFFFSVPIQRDDVHQDEFDEKGRRFTTMTQLEWLNCCRENGFESINITHTQDGLGRPGIQWMNCLTQRRN
ncbi:MAG: class I SAM-dependent methyltransferase [Desulfobacterales bacterium]|nr:class I SAM-dependent methyltransferase [Desulfobacterales bacterium]